VEENFACKFGLMIDSANVLWCFDMRFWDFGDLKVFFNFLLVAS